MGRGGKNKSYTTGYEYYLSMHMVLCHGPAVVTKIIVGDKTAWNGSLEDGSLYIDKYNLFGGKTSEGGIRGNLDIVSGQATQGQNSFLKSALDAFVPAYRGVVSVILKNFMVAAVNPYPKPWRFQVRRLPQVIPGDASINGYAANPAQIIAECLTNSEWGGGNYPADLDIDSFQKAAKTLQEEGFGLCARWDSQADIDSFIDNICEIIDAERSTSPITGQYTLKLIRDDYDPAALITLGPSDILSLTDFTRPDPSEIVNEVTVTYEDWETGEENSITETNTAALALNQSPNASTLEYHAIPTQSLARRVALRELAQLSSGRASCSLTVNRRAAALTKGDVFILNWPPLEIEAMIMRITNITVGSSTDWRVRLNCVQDIFALPKAEFTDRPGGWTPPSWEPAAIDKYLIYELPYYLTAVFITGDNESAWSDLPEGFGYFAVCANQPGGATLGFNIVMQDAFSVWTTDRSLSFTDYGLLTADIDDLATSFVIEPGTGFNPGLNEPLQVDDELMLLTAYNAATNQITVGRGAMDTVPAAHSAEAVVWANGLYNNAATQVYVTGQTVQTKLQPFASASEIALSACPTRNFTFRNRAARPIAPANIKINGLYRPKVLSAWASELSWARRDREDTVKIRTQTDGDFAPEAGTSYRVVIEEMVFPGSAWRQAANTGGLTGTALALAGLYTPQAYSLRLTLSAELNGLTSWQPNRISLVHEPWAPAVKNLITTSPPASPARGDMYVIGAGATGAWAGRAGQLAAWGGTAWLYWPPATGTTVKDESDGFKLYVFDGAAWQAA